MLKNYFIITIRNIKRNLSYSAINVFGLALGITCSMVLFLMITFYLSFDNYHDNKDRIYRIVTSSENNGREDFFAGVPAPLPGALASDITGIQHVLFTSGDNNALFTIIDNGAPKIFEQENGLAYSDSTYFTFFNRAFIMGDYKTALQQPNQIILSEKTAKKFFGEVNPMGQLIKLNNKTELKVTGIIEDHPDNTTFPFEILISYLTIQKDKEESGWNSVYSDDQCFVMLEAGTPPDAINNQFPAFVKKYETQREERSLKRWLQPLQEINYDSRFGNYRYTTVSKTSILAMGVVALFLLITACINFINLSTAVAVKRSKEVGIRKVLGSQRLQLMGQYLAETGMITLVALLISVGLSELALIQLNAFLDINLHVDFTDLRLITFLIGVWAVVSLASGFYPALLLSGFSPALALKNKITNRSTGGFALRRSLVVFQFVISQLLIVGTVILLAQMNFLESKDLGFSKDAVINVPIPNNAPLNNKKVLKSELLRMGGVERVSLCNTAPSSGSVSMTAYTIEGIEGNHLTQVKLTDEDYIDLFKIELLAGNNLMGLDSANSCLVNEKLLKSLGLEKPEEIIGRVISIWGMNLPVAGVVKDFHTISLEREIDPTILFNRVDSYRTAAIKLKGGSVKETLGEVERAWAAQYPDFLFSYEFLDNEIKEFYESEQKMSTLLILFSVIAITIGCLGLYGLISFMANEKEKEIGVRKVLGASTGNILIIFSKEFIILILVAFAIASPLAAYIMGQWLDNFAYRVPLTSLMFVTGIGITIIIAFVTVGFRSIRAALANPINALRNE
ncbi:MAG TPA: ABC transporter permease [Cyclobacteriaceae bacterium]|nr:ABC transporter permease [Cyclobacteriaceae bacterium]